MPRPIFLAAPERGAGALGLVDKIVLELQLATGGALKGSSIFVPHLQAGDAGIDTDAATYFTRSLQAINDARVVVAVLDGPQVDENVAFLVGCAFAAGKPVEFHLYQNGGHGFGLGNPDRTSNRWFEAFVHWLDVNGFLAAE